MGYYVNDQWVDDDNLSPYEQAHGEQRYDETDTAANAPNAFDKAVEEYYNNTSTGSQQEHNDTNWYKPGSYNWLINDTGSGGGPPPPPPPPPPGPRDLPGPGNQPGPRSAGPSSASSYRPPALTPSPFITPNGQVPPGLPFSPDPNAVRLQNEALERALQTPAVQPFVNPYQSAQSTLINKFLTEPAFGPDYINKLNEQQKEIALAREGAANRGVMQRSANRGVLQGGQVDASLRRNRTDTTQGLLQSQRDISTQVEGQNRQGYERAVSLADQIQQVEAAQKFREGTANRQALLDALSSSEMIYGGREDRGLNIAKLMETIREYDTDIQNRQAEFGSGMNFNYDRLNTDNRFNYDTLNSSNENSWLSYLARLAGR